MSDWFDPRAARSDRLGLVPDADDKPATVHANVDPPAKQRIGFALGGGGSRGSFGVGALSYLTGIAGIGASVVSGTSVGAWPASRRR